MPKALWKDCLLAESEDTVVVDGNHYFPRSSLIEECFRASSHRTVCGWKGEASYFDVLAGGEVNENAAWTYEEPLPAAEELRSRVAFWKGVRVES